MTERPLNLVLVSTPIGQLGSGRGGGVELTLGSVMRGLVGRGHQLSLVAPEGSRSPVIADTVKLHPCQGVDQPSWQHADRGAPMQIPDNGVLPRLWERALDLGCQADAVINFGYDWLPLWLTPHAPAALFHLVSMGSVSQVMDRAVAAVARWDQSRLAFHTRRQAQDFDLMAPPEVVGNGFDIKTNALYFFHLFKDYLIRDFFDLTSF